MFPLYFILLTIIFPAHNRCPNQEVRDDRDRPILDAYYESPSGNFWIHYDLTGDNAPDITDNDNNGVPDYVETAAEAADSAKYLLTQVMGYIEEEYDDDQKYDIYILELSSSLWGSCQSESGGGSFIKIRNTYNQMSDFCNDENDLLWLTIGHEFFHAIQYAYRSNSNDSYFRELTSMWFENIFVPDCYDFLDFVDNGSSSLFNNPEKGFDDNTSGQVGYSLALYGHYLSTIIDSNDFDDETSSTIMREIWERYSEGGTIFSSLKAVLQESEYNTTFQETWVDFMSRNMFCGEYDNMENNIYYHIGQRYINPPNIEYESLSNNTTITSEIPMRDDRVSIIGYQPTEQIMISSEFFSDSQSWYGSLSNNNIIVDISDFESYDFFSINDLNNLILIFSNKDGIDNISFTLNSLSNNLISVYPNPIDLSNNNLNIIYDLYLGEIYLEIFDLKGKSISKTSFLTSYYGRQYLDYNPYLDVPSGIYFLKISNNSQVDFVKLINIK